MITDIKVAFAFMTRIPIKHKPEISLRRAARWFPVVGAFVGLASATTYFLTYEIFGKAIAAALAMIISILITGAFHFDGLGDVADALVGGWNPEDRMRILKDSRHGTYAVVAISMQLILQFALVSSMKPRVAIGALIVSHTLARLVPIYLMLTKAAPNGEGMGATYAREVKIKDLAIANFLTLILIWPIIGITSFLYLILLIIPNVIFLIWVRRKIGGVVGDVLGAAAQISESFILLLFAGGLHF
jgi:adenosylcobinamide-GDP ribazoletransferase